MLEAKISESQKFNTNYVDMIKTKKTNNKNKNKNKNVIYSLKSKQLDSY